mmetsp:Transcript_10072/g.11465  ORF Transcript_10072/g.11465 Transcript_10072/m.11465 type:complete len:136 (+) Transcript_10072:573-980(+)
MTVYMFGIKHSLTAYKVIIDYSEMIAEIANGEESLYSLSSIQLWNSVVNTLENIADKSSEYHLQMAMMNYFLKSNEIFEEQFFNNEKQYGRKKAKQILSAFPFSSISELAQEPEYPAQTTYMIEETKMDFLQIND